MSAFPDIGGMSAYPDFPLVEDDFTAWEAGISGLHFGTFSGYTLGSPRYSGFQYGLS